MSTIRDVVKIVKRKTKSASRKLEKVPKNIKVEISSMVAKMQEQLHKRLVSLEKKVHALNGGKKLNQNNQVRISHVKEKK